MQVVAFAGKERMLLHVQHYVKVARRTAKRSCLPVTTEADPRPVLNTGWNLRLHHPLPQHPPLALAFRARIGNDAAGTLAGRARARHGEKPLLIANLPSSLTGAACHRGLPRGRPTPRALLARLVAAHRDLRLGPKHGLFELQRQVFAKVRTALRPRAAPPAGCAEKIANPKKLAKNVAEVLERARIESPSSRRARDPRVTEAVIRRTLLGIHQDRIGLGHFFEFLFGVGIVRISIRMVLHGELAVRALDLLLATLPLDPEDLVVVAFHVTGQNFAPPALRGTLARLIPGTLRDLHHGRPNQPVFQLVPPLQFYNHLMIVPPRSPPSRWLRAHAGQKARPWRAPDAPPAGSGHPAIACRSVPPRCGTRSADWLRSAARARNCRAPAAAP